MTIKYAKSFWKHYDKLRRREKIRVKEAIALFLKLILAPHDSEITSSKVAWKGDEPFRSEVI